MPKKKEKPINKDLLSDDTAYQKAYNLLIKELEKICCKSNESTKENWRTIREKLTASLLTKKEADRGKIAEKWQMAFISNKEFNGENKELNINYLTYITMAYLDLFKDESDGNKVIGDKYIAEIDNIFKTLRETILIQQHNWYANFSSWFIGFLASANNIDQRIPAWNICVANYFRQMYKTTSDLKTRTRLITTIKNNATGNNGYQMIIADLTFDSDNPQSMPTECEFILPKDNPFEHAKAILDAHTIVCDKTTQAHINSLPLLYKNLRDKNKGLDSNELNGVFYNHVEDKKIAANCILKYHNNDLTTSISEALLIEDNEYLPYLISSSIKELSPQEQIEKLLNILREFQKNEIIRINNAVTNENCDINQELKNYFTAITEMLYGKREDNSVLNIDFSDDDSDIYIDDGDDGKDESDTTTEEFSINKISEPINRLVTDSETKANESIASSVLLLLDNAIQNSKDNKFLKILRSYNTFINDKEPAPDLYKLNKNNTQISRQYDLPDVTNLNLHPSIIKYLARLKVSAETETNTLKLIKEFLQIESRLSGYCIHVAILEQNEKLVSITAKIREDNTLSLSEKARFYKLLLPNMHEINSDKKILEAEIIAIADMLSTKNKNQDGISIASFDCSSNTSDTASLHSSRRSSISSSSSASSIDETIVATITTAITDAITAYKVDQNFINTMIDGYHKKSPKKTFVLYRLLKDGLKDIHVPENAKIDFSKEKEPRRKKLTELWKLLGKELFTKYFNKLFNDVEKADDILGKCIFSLVSHEKTEIKNHDILPTIICASIQDDASITLQNIFNTYYMHGDLNYYIASANTNRREMFVAAIVTAHKSSINNDIDKPDNEIATIYRRGYYKTALLSPEETCKLIDEQKPKDGGLRRSLQNVGSIGHKSKPSITAAEKLQFAQILDMVSTDKQYAKVNNNVDEEELKELFRSLFNDNKQNRNTTLQNLTAADQGIYETFITAAIGGYIVYAQTIEDGSRRNDAIKQIYDKFAQNDLLTAAIKQSDNNIKIAYLIAAKLDNIAELHENIKAISPNNKTELSDALIKKLERKTLIALLKTQKKDSDTTLFNAIIKKLVEELTKKTIGDVFDKIVTSNSIGIKSILNALLEKTDEDIKTEFLASLLANTESKNDYIKIMLATIPIADWGNTLSTAKKVVDKLEDDKISDAVNRLAVKKFTSEKKETAIPRLAIYHNLLIKFLESETVNSDQVKIVCVDMYKTQHRMNASGITRQLANTNISSKSNITDHKAVIMIANILRKIENDEKITSCLRGSKNTQSSSIASAIKDPKKYLNEKVIAENQKTEYKYYLKIIDELNKLKHQPPLNADLGLTIKQNEDGGLFSAIKKAISNDKISPKDIVRQSNLWFVPRDNEGKISHINGTDLKKPIDIDTALKDNFLAMQALSWSLARPIIVFVAGDSIPPFEINLKPKKNNENPILLHLDRFGNYHAIYYDNKYDIRTHIGFDKKIQFRNNNTLGGISANYLEQEKDKKSGIINGAIDGFVNSASSTQRENFTNTTTYIKKFTGDIKIDLNDPTNCYLVLDTIIAKYNSNNHDCYITMLTTVLNKMSPDTLDRAELLLGILNEKCRYKFDQPLLHAAKGKNIMLANILLDDAVDSLKKIEGVSASTKWQLLLDSTKELNIHLPSLQFSKERRALISKKDYWLYYDEDHLAITDAIGKALWSTKMQQLPNVEAQTLSDLSEQLKNNDPQAKTIKEKVAEIEQQYGCTVILWRNIKDSNGIETYYKHESICPKKPIIHVLYDNGKYFTITTNCGQKPLTTACSQKEPQSVLFAKTMRLTIKDERNNLCKVETASDGCDFLRAIGAYSIKIAEPDGTTHKPSNQKEIEEHIKALHEEGGNTDNINFANIKLTDSTNIQKILNAMCYTLQLGTINIYTKKGLHTIKASNEVAGGKTLELLYHGKKYYIISRLTPICAISDGTKTDKQIGLLNLISRFRNYPDSLKPLITAYCNQNYCAENKVATIANNLLSAAKDKKLEEKTDALKEITDIGQIRFIISLLLNATDSNDDDADNFILSVVAPENYYGLFLLICKNDPSNADRFVEILKKYPYVKIFNEKDASNLKDIKLDDLCNFSDHLDTYIKATKKETNLTEALSTFSGGKKLFTDSEPKLERVTASWISVLIGSSLDYKKITDALTTLLKQKNINPDIIADIFYWICKNNNISNDNISKVANHIIGKLKTIVSTKDSDITNAVATRIIAQTIYRTNNDCADAIKTYNTLIDDSLLWKACFNLRKSIISEDDCGFQQLFNNIWDKASGDDSKKREFIRKEVYLAALPLLDGLKKNDDALHRLYEEYNAFTDSKKRPKINYKDGTFSNIAGMYELALMQDENPMHRFIFSLKTYQPITALLSSFDNSSNFDIDFYKKLFADAVNAMEFDKTKPSKLLPLDLEKAFRDIIDANQALQEDVLCKLFVRDETSSTVDCSASQKSKKTQTVSLPEVNKFYENFTKYLKTIKKADFGKTDTSITENLLSPILSCPALIFHNAVQKKINGLSDTVKAKFSTVNAKYADVINAINSILRNTPNSRNCYKFFQTQQKQPQQPQQTQQQQPPPM